MLGKGVGCYISPSCSYFVRPFRSFFCLAIAITMAAENRAPEVTGVATLFLILSTLTILARSYCRIFVVKGFGLDDWFAVIAWVRCLNHCFEQH